MTVTKTSFGTSREGEPVERFVVEAPSGLAFAAISYGAILQSVKAPDASGRVAEVTLGFDDLASYEGKHPYFGATVGRVANRIRGARFRLGRKSFPLEANNGPNTLHGGGRGFDRYVWKAEAFGDHESAGVTFSRVSPDGEEGFPGTLRIAVSYSLTEAGELRIDYQAETDAATPVNLTNHSYWNLAGAGTGTILDQEVQLSCSRYLPVDEETLPTGEIRDVAGTPFDFRQGKPVGQDLEAAGGGYDHCFVVDLESASAPGAESAGSGDGCKICPVARVTDPASGRVMFVESTLPGLQFYTGNKLAGVADRSSAALPKHAALCLETQFFPDAPNQPQFPSIMLHPKEEYRHTTVYRFSTV